MFDRTTYFDNIRSSLFCGSMTQQQVDGQDFKLSTWEKQTAYTDLRWLAYCMATSFHETAATMWPIEEYSRGSGQPYGVKDPETGQVYYGRGDVQLTWRDNYQRATTKLGLIDDANLVWHAAMALDPTISADVLFVGMAEGWFTGKKLPDYFNTTKDDPVNARIIVNNDVSKMGKTVAGYYDKFRTALLRSYTDAIPPPAVVVVVDIQYIAPPGVEVVFNVTQGS